MVLPATHKVFKEWPVVLSYCIELRITKTAPDDLLLCESWIQVLDKWGEITILSVILGKVVASRCYVLLWMIEETSDKFSEDPRSE